MSASATLTPSGEAAEGQLFGGPQDGRDVLIPLTNGRPPFSIIRPSGRYLADGCLPGGLYRYSLEGHPRPLARKSGSADSLP
jgi:hypothetical protein